MDVKLIENDLDEKYARVTHDNGDEEIYKLSQGEALIVSMLIAWKGEVDELVKKIK